jgi:hypothetical protein
VQRQTGSDCRCGIHDDGRLLCLDGDVPCDALVAEVLVLAERDMPLLLKDGQLAIRQLAYVCMGRNRNRNCAVEMTNCSEWIERESVCETLRI